LHASFNLRTVIFEKKASHCRSATLVPGLLFALTVCSLAITLALLAALVVKAAAGQAAPMRFVVSGQVSRLLPASSVPLFVISKFCGVVTTFFSLLFWRTCSLRSKTSRSLFFKVSALPVAFILCSLHAACNWRYVSFDTYLMRATSIPE
jgi:hypothetical protein